MSKGSVTAGGSAKERPSRAWREEDREGGEARSVVFYEGLRFWEGHLCVCMCRGGSPGAQNLGAL